MHAHACATQVEDNEVFDVVDEDEYRRIVRKRRADAKFVVDDGMYLHATVSPCSTALTRLCCGVRGGADGLGYADDGEEFIDNNLDPSKRPSGKRGRKGGLHSSSLRGARRLNTGMGAQTSKVDTMLTASAVDRKRVDADKKRKAAALMQEDSACLWVWVCPGRCAWGRVLDHEVRRCVRLRRGLHVVHVW